MSNIKIYILALSFFALLLFSSFGKEDVCKYAASNIGFIKEQTELAIEATTVNKARFLTFRAINAYEKSKNQIEECGCADAMDTMDEAYLQLKQATKKETLDEINYLLNLSLENVLRTLIALEEYDDRFGSDVLALNTVSASKHAFKKDEVSILKEKIDISLISYEASLQVIVETVNCKEARAFATRVFENCQKELLRSDLSEGKRYYNLRTKNITEMALRQIGECGKPMDVLTKNVN